MSEYVEFRDGAEVRVGIGKGMGRKKRGYV